MSTCREKTVNWPPCMYGEQYKKQIVRMSAQLWPLTQFKLQWYAQSRNGKFALTLSIVSTDMRITRSGRRSTAQIRPYAADGSPPSILCKAHHIWSFSLVASKPFPTNMTSLPPVGPCRSFISIMARQSGPHRESRPFDFAALSLLNFR